MFPSLSGVLLSSYVGVDATHQQFMTTFSYTPGCRQTYLHHCPRISAPNNLAAHFDHFRFRANHVCLPSAVQQGSNTCLAVSISLLDTLDVLDVFLWFELHDYLLCWFICSFSRGGGSHLTTHPCGDGRLIVMAARSAKHARRFHTCSKVIPNVRRSE